MILILFLYRNDRCSLCLLQKDDIRSQGPLSQLVKALIELNDDFVDKMNAEIDDENQKIYVCDFYDGKHDDFGDYLHDYYEQVEKVNKIIDVYIFKHIIFLPDQLGLSAALKSKLDGTIEKYIVYISKYLSSSHANVLMLFFKDMSTNEFAIDLFQFKNGALRSVENFKELFDPEQLGVFYKVDIDLFMIPFIYICLYMLMFPDLLFNIYTKARLQNCNGHTCRTSR